MIQHSPACERNRDPILKVLQQVLAESTAVLEISAGTGMHAVHMAAGLPHLSWLPSDISEHALLSIQAWAAIQPASNLCAAIQIDVCNSEWPVDNIDAIFNANMIHISPWEATQGLLAGAGRLLPHAGKLIMYGPYKIDGEHTSPSNARFDASLRARDRSWGVRDLKSVAALAASHGLQLEAQIQMPANNLIVVYQRVLDG